ncbi:hypothetical protein [Pleionea sp. CnH1-48]|uniref:DarT1-associated NADAR antitoxin family protein n=1 Tax=Pleionea sp. CnH1-48 TaxID=2954494 RepID=UPI0020977E99|nr:hypothetical protein [Pleionea sp. CnH1-48]MCO7226741.1 hypothetical protein [Pleionea sp. CnH1-48]
MAQRPVFSPSNDQSWVSVASVEFTWFGGFSIQQKQRCIQSLHKAFNVGGDKRILEISSKSTESMGVRLSAFNLRDYFTGVPLECAFQAAKVFTSAGPFSDLLEKTPRDAKRDERLRNSGPMTHFLHNGCTWPLEPKTMFYNWLYLNAVYHDPQLKDVLLAYDAFTDIEFNPARSINCQAYSAALYVSLHKEDLLKQALSSPEKFSSTVAGRIL